MSLESASSAFGFNAKTLVYSDRRVSVAFDGQNVSRGVGMPFAPQTNNRGDLAYATTLVAGPKGALALADIYLNDERIAKDRPILDLAMNDDGLAWLETGASGSVLITWSFLTQKVTVQKLPIWAERIVADGSHFIANGLTPSGETVVAVSDIGGPALLTNLDTSAVFLGGSGDGVDLLRVGGTSGGKALFAALDRFERSNLDGFGQIDNEAGRLAWHQSYRLAAAADLALATGDQKLGAQAAAAALETLASADASGNYPSVRYSLGDQPFSASVHSAFIYHGAFAAFTWMDAVDRQELVSQAERSFASYESDWFDYGYRITPGVDYALDGIIQPINMQSAMGLLALDLYQATGKGSYKARAKDIFDNISEELVDQGGTKVWNYWPKMFRDGWSSGTFQSTNLPSFPASPASRYEDVYHAAVTIEFLLLGEKVLGLQPAIDANALFRSIELGPFNFSASLAGSSGGYQYLPPWPDSSLVRSLLTRDLPTLLPHYDSGVYDWLYADAARQSVADGLEQLIVERLDPITLAVKGSIVLNDAQSILAFVQSNSYEALVTPTPVAVGTSATDIYQGTDQSDTIRLLDGDDRATLGLGDDVAFGDFGSDTLTGQGGADQLFGGFGDDVLEGDAGNDLLSGQAGDDALIGGDGDDVLIGGGGNDFLNGGLGFDIAVFGSRRGVEVTHNADGTTTIRGPDGTDTAIGVEELRFSDTTKWSFEDPGLWTLAAPGADGWMVGDFNGDRRDDVLRYLPGQSGADVFLSSGSAFDASGSWTGAGYGDGWHVGDFNGDSKDDLLRYLPGQSGADIFLSTGSAFVRDGSWTGAGRGVEDWYIGDFNGDGRDDLFRYLPGQSGADVFLSTGTGFVRSGSWTGAGHGSERWYVGDFDGDGRDDLFRYLPGQSGADVLLSNGSSFIRSGSWTAADHGGNRWHVADYNGDGKDDIFRYLPGNSGADMFLSTGTGFVADGSWTAVGNGTDGWVIGDYSGDGTADLMRLASSGGYVLI